MKASAGTAVKGRGAPASRPAAPHRSKTPPPARSAAIKKPAPAKGTAPAAAKATPVAKVVAKESKAAKQAPAAAKAPAKQPAPKVVAKPTVVQAPVAEAEKPPVAKATVPPPAPPVAAPPAPPSPPMPEAAPADRRPMMPDRPPPRPPSKPENFAEGDHVVYPTHGVGKVERIAIEEIAGHKLELIHITFEENRMTLRVPVAKARSAGLRKLATRKLFDEALAVLRGRARIKRTMWSRRAQEYEAKINSGDPLAIAEVVRDLHRNAGQPDQSFSERQIYEAAMDRLAAELAALDKTDKMTAATKLTDFLKTI